MNKLEKLKMKLEVAEKSKSKIAKEWSRGYIQAMKEAIQIIEEDNQ